MSTATAPEFTPFFKGLETRRLAFPCCADCGRFHWYPKPACPHCLSSGIEWRAVEGRGAVYSFTTVRHAFDPAWADNLPYVVALVTFEDAPGVRLITRIIDAAPGELAIGATVRPAFPEAGQPNLCVLFRIAAQAA